MGFWLFAGTVVVVVSSESFVKTQLRGDWEWRDIRMNSDGFAVLFPVDLE